ncbi:glycoside hydrolase family 16 protein [Curtobacterium sp. 1P10AnD]|uniref:glycoside hydrolase family 16 protein n=1 Tax=Curtobacterium sp. 1P10AnD TaxID=3132283 RepID=UPI0039A0AAC7
MTRQRTSQRRERTTSRRGALFRGATVLGVAGVTGAVMLAFLTPAQGSELVPSLSPSPSSSTSTGHAGAAATRGTTDTGEPTGAAASETPSRSTQEGTLQPRIPTATPTATATPTVPDPVLGPQAAFFEDFTTPAASGGQFATTYANAWQAYDEGTSDKYYSGALISAHDGVMDVAMNGTQGAAGVFGPPATAWAQTGGTFSIRMKVEGGRGNGTAVMLWPTSNDASEGELDYPEGGFSGKPDVFHHSMVPGHADKAYRILTDASWKDWHTYTTVWVPGKSVSYFLDGVLLETVTESVPTTPHRYTFQIGNTGKPGHVLIDWVSIQP